MNEAVVEDVVPAIELAGRAAVVAGCAYEIVALTTRRVPTITSLVHELGRRGPAGRLAVWAIGGFVAYHFMEKLAE